MSNTRRLLWFALGFVLGGTIAAKAYSAAFDPDRYWENSKALGSYGAVRGCVMAGKNHAECLLVGDLVRAELERL